MSRASLVPRLITEAEAAVVERALTVASVTDIPASILASVRSLRVVDRCGCGCASVDFAAPSSNGDVAVQLADAIGTSPTGQDLGIIVWGNGGSVSGLEVYGYTDEPALLPVLTSIAPWSGGDANAA